MDQIEPIRLDTNLLNTALQVGLHQQSQQELMRHHGEIEGKANEKLALDSSEQTIKDPDASPFQKYQAANTRYKIMAPGHGDLPPVDYNDNAPDWNNFLLNLNTTGSQSPETIQSLMRLNQNSPYFRQKAEQAQRLKQQQEMSTGWQDISKMPGGPGVSPEASLAIQHSPAAQKEFAQAAAPSPKDVAMKQEIDARKAYLGTQEAGVTQAKDALSKAVTPFFNLDAESSLATHLDQTRALGKPTPQSHDQASADAGASTTTDLNMIKQEWPKQREQLGQSERQLRAELNKAKYDTSGGARSVEQISADLDAVRSANAIKGRELAYARNKTRANREALQQAYQAHEQKMSTYTNQIKSLREASLHVVQSSTDLKALQERDLAAAQTHYLEHKNLLETAKIYPTVPPEKIREVDKELNRPLVDIKLSEGLAKEIGPMMAESRNAAIGAIDTLDAVGRARTAIDKGLVSLGPTATIRNKIGQVSQMLGVGGDDNAERLVNTRNVMRSLAQFSLGARKQLKGQGQVSDFEGKLIVKAESGEIDDLTMPELKAFLSVTDRLAHKQYAMHQQNLKTMKGNPKLSEIASFYDVPDLPTEQRDAPSAGSQSAPTATGPGGQKLILKDGTWQPLKK